MLIPDHETEVDFLNCEAIATTVAEVLRSNRSRPLTVGIHGDWGAGKSSILKMIEMDLSADKKVAVLWFNGWTFEGFDNAKTVLIEATIKELCRQRLFTGKAKELVSKLLERVDWLKVAKHISGLAFNTATGLPALGQLKELSTSVATTEDATNNAPDTIYAFREEFKDLLNEANINQLVVLIDDLDRCLPTTSIETLEAIRLFLFVPKTAFVIGADEAMIEYAVRQHFPDLPQSSGPLPYARNYLEKLIQIPFRIPALGSQETRAYVTLLLVQSVVGEDHDGFRALLEKTKEGLKKPWLGETASQRDVQAVQVDRREDLDAVFVLAQQIAPMLAEGTNGNPRQIKRFLNALLIRQVIAKVRGFGGLISQPVLAKLMLAERFQPDFYEHVGLQVMASNDGISSDLIALESANEEKPKEKSKKGSQKKVVMAERGDNGAESKWLERDWLIRWRAIKPSIGTTDLRPYVFVARDKRLLGDAGIASSHESLIARLCGSRLGIRAFEPEVKTLTPGDCKIVFASLRERILSTDNLRKIPPGMDGISIVVKHHPQLQSELVQLIGSLDIKELGPWAVKGWNESVTQPQEKNELMKVLNGWSQQDDNKILKNAALAALRSIQGGND